MPSIEYKSLENGSPFDLAIIALSNTVHEILVSGFKDPVQRVYAELIYRNITVDHEPVIVLNALQYLVRIINLNSVFSKDHVLMKGCQHVLDSSKGIVDNTKELKLTVKPQKHGQFYVVDWDKFDGAYKSFTTEFKKYASQEKLFNFCPDPTTELDRERQLKMVARIYHRLLAQRSIAKNHPVIMSCRNILENYPDREHNTFLHTAILGVVNCVRLEDYLYICHVLMSTKNSDFNQYNANCSTPLQIIFNWRNNYLRRSDAGFADDNIFLDIVINLFILHPKVRLDVPLDPYLSVRTIRDSILDSDDYTLAALHSGKITLEEVVGEEIAKYCFESVRSKKASDCETARLIDVPGVITLGTLTRIVVAEQAKKYNSISRYVLDTIQLAGSDVRAKLLEVYVDIKTRFLSDCPPTVFAALKFALTQIPHNYQPTVKQVEQKRVPYVTPTLSVGMFKHRKPVTFHVLAPNTTLKRSLIS